MSRFLSLKLLAIDGSKSRALTRIRAATATGSGSNLVRHFSLGQALGVNLVEPEVVDFNTNPPPERNPNDPRCNDPDDVPSIAVILTGCGYRDGTVVYEAVYTMMHLHRHNKLAALFAPTSRIERLFNGSKEEKLQNVAPRFMLNESARMTWDRVYPFDELRVEDHQGLIIPGGTGIFNHLTDYFTREPDNAHEFWMDETLNRTLLDFYRHRKPMGFLSLASLLAARVFQGVHITLCDEATRQSDLVILDRFLATGERTGATLVNRNIFQALHDTNYHIYSSPGSMTTAIPPERIYYNISEGIGNLVDQMVQSL